MIDTIFILCFALVTVALMIIGRATEAFNNMRNDER